MSGAACFLCETNVGQLSGGIGQADQPLGCCNSCHSFACGLHAHRDRNVPEYICVLCDPSLLAASAVVLDGAQDVSPAFQRIVYRADLGPYSLEMRRFADFNDFLQRRPNYPRSLFDEIRDLQKRLYTQKERREEMLHALSRLSLEAQHLFLAAGLILFRFEVPQEQIDEDLLPVRNLLLG